MTMPVNFRYREVFLKGKPCHDRLDAFRIRHPSMDRGRRAKIFAPFDALKGFSEAVAAKDVLYEERITLSQEDQEELNRRLAILHGLTYNGRMARANRVQVTVTHLLPAITTVIANEVWHQRPATLYLAILDDAQAVQLGRQARKAVGCRQGIPRHPSCRGRHHERRG